MRATILMLVSLLAAAPATGQELKKADVSAADFRAQLRDAAAETQPARAAQMPSQELLFYADTTGGDFLAYPLPGGSILPGIVGSAVRFTPSIDGHIFYIGFLVNGGNNPDGDGILKMTRRHVEVQPWNGWNLPSTVVDSVRIDFDQLIAGHLNVLMTLDDPDWEVNVGEDFFITFEVEDVSPDGNVELLVDRGTSDRSDPNYHPVRTILYGTSPPRQQEGWDFQFTNFNNQVVFAAIVNIVDPDLLEPPRNAKDLGDRVTLRWTSERRADDYVVQVSTDIDFLTVDLERVVTDTSVTLENLSPGTTYHWRVWGRNTDGDGLVSAASLFATSVTAAAERPDHAHALSLSIYPAPVVDWAEIRFDADGSEPYEVAIYDLLGRKVDTIEQGWTKTGPTTVSWTPGELPSGLYLVHISVGAQRAVRPLTLIRK